MIVLSLRLSKGPEMDPYLYYCGQVSLQIMRSRGLRGGLWSGLRKQLHPQIGKLDNSLDLSAK